MAMEERFIEELLHNVTVSGNRVLERRLADLVLWYYKQKQSIPPADLLRRMALAEKALWISFEVHALALERQREDRSNNALWVPNGLNVEGDLRRFG